MNNFDDIDFESFEEKNYPDAINKVDNLINKVEEERNNTRRLYKDKIKSLKELSSLLKDMKKSFLKGK